MTINQSDIVRSLNGRDAGKLFVVIGIEGEFALIADGKGRRLEKPKRKKMKHLHLVATRDCRTAFKLKNGIKISNGEIRRALADYSAETGEKGGM